ncbi:MAG: Electron transport complex protein RnfA [candidate division TA06 bacterium ADurb.Bin417]|uniref:Ion-translocating oxidoreductase complex subunit A n=1 Tax=candidate division TA06 bacterium ADurb.Bin417 TaxID=1852828 RepID=A0A1V5MCT6_UNCT6|nr:MAG: Electron transport complex protein RnfA [candidate division TA06 bacterium ADurb.Bin417]
MLKEIVLLMLGSILINNFVFAYFLGTCPYLGVTDKLSSSLSLGAATTFVMTLTAPIVWLINNYLLVRFNLIFLQNVTFILVIAVLVQLVEMFIRKTSPVLYRTLGIFLPLITTNCCILFLAILIPIREYSLVTSLFFGIGSGLGFMLALIIMAGIREELSLADIPPSLKGAPLTLILAGLIALSFMGFAGLL